MHNSSFRSFEARPRSVLYFVEVDTRSVFYLLVILFDDVG